jgi:transcriptional regulator with XRE-family HTH domain
MTQKSVGEILSLRRKLLGVTQEYLSELSGVGLRTIKQIENDEGNPTLETVRKLAEVLGLELELKVKEIE